MPKRTKIFKIIAIIFVGWLAFTFIRNSYLLWQAGGRLDEAKNQLQAAENQHQELQNLLSQVDSPEFIEEEARNKLGLAKPNEVVVILPPEDQLKKIAPDLSVKSEVFLPNWRQWANLFLTE